MKQNETFLSLKRLRSFPQEETANEQLQSSSISLTETGPHPTGSIDLSAVSNCQLQIRDAWKKHELKPGEYLFGGYPVDKSGKKMTKLIFEHFNGLCVLIENYKWNPATIMPDSTIVNLLPISLLVRTCTNGNKSGMACLSFLNLMNGRAFHLKPSIEKWALLGIELTTKFRFETDTKLEDQLADSWESVRFVRCMKFYGIEQLRWCGGLAASEC